MALVNGKIIKPKLTEINSEEDFGRLISEKTSEKLNNMLRKVVTDEEVQLILDVDGYYAREEKQVPLKTIKIKK